MTGAPSAALAREGAVAMDLLEGGEAILLAIRPSLWFVLIVSGRVIVVAALAAVAIRLAGPRLDVALPPYALAMLWAIVVLVRLFAASIQWLGRLYVLTNRRLITVKGVSQFQVRQCLLAKVRGVELSAGKTERLLGLGTLSFALSEGRAETGDWVNLARPAKVKEAIERAIRSGGLPG